MEQEGLRGCFRFARLHLLKNKSAAHTGPQFHLVPAAKKALFCDITSACLDVLLGKGVQILFLFFYQQWPPANYVMNLVIEVWLKYKLLSSLSPCTLCLMGNEQS